MAYHPRVAGPNRHVLRFTSTAKASADAHALAWVGLSRLDVVVDFALIVLSLLTFASGNAIVGSVFIFIAVLSLVNGRFHWIQRGVTAARYRSILGQSTEVTVDDEGLRFENTLASSFVPWSSVETVRTNGQTVAFFRGNVLLGYIPSGAFEWPAAQADVVTFVRSRIAPASPRSGLPRARRRGP